MLAERIGRGADQCGQRNAERAAACTLSGVRPLIRALAVFALGIGVVYALPKHSGDGDPAQTSAVEASAAPRSAASHRSRSDDDATGTVKIAEGRGSSGTTVLAAAAPQAPTPAAAPRPMVMAFTAIEPPPFMPNAEPAAAPPPAAALGASRSLSAPVAKTEALAIAMPQPRPAALAALAEPKPKPSVHAAKPDPKAVKHARHLIYRKQLAAGRQELEQAAIAGDPAAAITLAKTYDPAVLRSWKIAGAKPDVALARQWYERARELGSREASKRLASLTTQP
jgi:hypothetical protein